MNEKWQQHGDYQFRILRNGRGAYQGEIRQAGFWGRVSGAVFTTLWQRTTLKEMIAEAELECERRTVRQVHP